MSTVKERLRSSASLFQKYDSPISITTRMAQFVVESQAGASELFKKSNNGFGIKVSVPWTGDKVLHNSNEVGGARDSYFRKYPTLEASIADNAGFFTSTDYRANTAYKKAIDAGTYKEEANALTGIYAGDPLYGQKLIKAVEDYNLTQYDTKKESVKMPTVLLIAGHGLNKNNGYFDPGAQAYVPKGEHRWYAEDVFPAMKKYLPDNADVVFHTAYNVYSHKNLVSLAKSYGSDTIVIECHFDAGGAAYSKAGGHVIIYSGFEPDALDLRLRDAIKATVGLHPTYANGISQRSNLQNVNLAANGGINYRLVEWGMATDKANGTYMVNNVDKIAKAFVEAIYGESKEAGGATSSEPNNSPTSDFDLPAYKEPTKPFKELKVGDTATVRAPHEAWYIPATNKGRKPSKDHTGMQFKITRVIECEVGYSKRAYLLDGPVSFILEQDVVEARDGWNAEDKDQQKQLDYVYIDGVKRAIGDVIE